MKSKLVFFYLGFFSFIIQLVLIREFINLFYGNEFFVCAILFSWLISTGLGSLYYSKLKGKLKFNAEIYFYLAVYFFLLIVLNRFLIGRIKYPGEDLNIFLSFAITFIKIFPLCFLIGYIFPFFFEKYNLELSRAYMFENLGFIIAGLIFYLFLIKNNFLISVFFLFILTGFILFYEKKFYGYICVFLGFLIVLFNNKLEKITLNPIFKNENIIQNIYTYKGKLTVAKRDNQFNFYYNNKIITSDEETFNNELKIHIPFLFAKRYEEILFAGNSFNGILNEIYKYRPQKVVYLDADEYIYEKSIDYIKNEFRDNIQKSFVKNDLSSFVLNTKERFDIMVLNIPPPDSLEVNRFYSKEFLIKIKKLMREKAILISYLKYSSGYLTEEIKRENISYYRTLKDIFNDVIFFPDEENIFIAFNQKPENNTNFYLEKFKGTNIHLKTIGLDYLKYRLNNDKIDEFKEFIKEDKKTSINSFLKPEIYVYSILNQIRVFYPFFSKFYISLMDNKIVSGILLSFFFLFLFCFLRKYDRVFIRISVLSFSLISLEIISIYLFEINFGKPIEGITIIISLIMIGIAAGSAMEKNNNLLYRHILPLSVFSVIGYFLFLHFSYKILLFLLTFFEGFVLGFSFNIFSNKIPPQKGNLLYGFDLLGSVFGVLFTSLFFIPLFGIKTTLGIIIFLLFLIWLI